MKIHTASEQQPSVLLRYEELSKPLSTIQFCSYTKKEATDLFESWQAENGYNIPEYTVQTVYNRADAEEYGAEYFVKQRNYPE